jgi:hypothetical protein
MNMFEFLFIFASADCVRHLSVTFIVSQTITYRRLLRYTNLYWNDCVLCDFWFFYSVKRRLLRFFNLIKVILP